jgi:hypothetical protein
MFSDKRLLHTQNLTKRGRWVYEGGESEEKNYMKASGSSVLQRLQYAL